MIKIYEIGKEKLAAVKAVLEAKEEPSEELGVEIEVGEGKKTETVKAEKWKTNEFLRHGYLLREARSLGIEKECSYLYIDASEDFFERNEKILLDAGAKLLEGEELENVKEKIKSEEESAAESVGAVFG